MQKTRSALLLLNLSLLSIIEVLMGLFRGAVFHHGGGDRNQPIEQPTSTMASMGRFPSLMGRLAVLPLQTGKSHPWTHTSLGETSEELSGPLVHTNFPRKRYGPMIGPYEFPPKLVWTNGAQSSLKVSVLTGIGP